MKSSHILFHEKQYFNQVWLWILMIGILFAPVFESFFEDTFEWNFPKTIYMIIVSLLMGFLAIIRLETKVFQEGVSVQFTFFHRKPKCFLWHEIEKFESIHYHPIRDYGGWGIRFGGIRSMAYSTKGSQGMMIYLKNNHKVLVGSQKIDLFEKALHSIPKS